MKNQDLKTVMIQNAEEAVEILTGVSGGPKRGRRTSSNSRRTTSSQTAARRPSSGARRSTRTGQTPSGQTTAKTGTKSQPSYSSEVEAKFKSATEIMLYYIAQYEGFKTDAYHGGKDPKGLYTIGFGNTTHPDGTPIKMGDKITSAEQAKEYVYAYLKDTWENMAKSLPVERMTIEQIVAVADLMYNSGNGRLKVSPILTQAIKNYIDNPSEENRKKLADLWSRTASAVENNEYRRKQEVMAFTGDLKIGLGPSSEYPAEQYLDLKRLAMSSGCIGSFGRENSQRRKSFMFNLDNYLRKETPEERVDSARTHIEFLRGVKGPTVDGCLSNMNLGQYAQRRGGGRQ